MTVYKQSIRHISRTMSDRRPGGTRVGAVKARCVLPQRLEFAELFILLRRRKAHLALSSGCDVAILLDVARRLSRIRAAVRRHVQCTLHAVVVGTMKSGMNEVIARTRLELANEVAKAGTITTTVAIFFCPPGFR